MVTESINYFANQIIALFTQNRNTIEGIDEREVEAWVKESLSFVGVGDYWKNYKEMNQAIVEGYWLVPFQITLTDDATYGRKVAILTESHLALPKNRGVVKVKSNTGLTLTKVDFDAWDDAQGGSVMTFTNNWFYALVAGKVMVLPNCKDIVRVPFPSVIVTQAVSNNATMTESQTMLVYQHVFPKMQARYGIPPDTKTDDFPKPTVINGQP